MGINNITRSSKMLNPVAVKASAYRETWHCTGGSLYIQFVQLASTGSYISNVVRIGLCEGEFSKLEDREGEE